MRLGPARAGRCDHPLSALQSASMRGIATTRDLLKWPLVDALISWPTNAVPKHDTASRRPSLTLSGVRGPGERRDAGEELWRLPVEQSHGGQGLRGAHGSAFCLTGPDDRADWELPVEELRRLGHDQVRLVQLTAPVQVGERQPGG